MPRFNRAYRGLYGNRMIQFGNRVTFAGNKRRRTWKPNVQKKSMYSETLDRMLQFRMTTYVMRCIRKAGGLDEYLIKTKDSELKYPAAIRFKEKIIELKRAKGEVVKDVRKGVSLKDWLAKKQARKEAIANSASPLKPTSVANAGSRGLLEILD